MSRQKTAGIHAGRPPGLGGLNTPSPQRNWGPFLIWCFNNNVKMGSSLRWNDELKDAALLVIPSAARICLLAKRKNRSLAALGMTRNVGPLLSLFHAAGKPSPHPDPEGGAQDVRRFPTEPKDGESENPGHLSGRCLALFGEAFLW